MCFFAVEWLVDLRLVCHVVFQTFTTKEERTLRPCPGSALRSVFNSWKEETIMSGLTITRKETESVYCTLPSGEMIRFTIQRLKNSQALVSISAPDNVLISRGELLVPKDFVP